MADNSTIRVKAKKKSDFIEVKALINHPMENGLHKDQETGNLTPAHFIEEIECQLNGQVVMTAVWGGGISKNPYLAFQIKGGKVGDVVAVKWTDNQGKTDEVAVSVQ